MTTRAEIVAEARTWQGTPFQHHQATKGIGTDCIGLIAGVGNETGITSAWFDGRAARYRGYGKTPDPKLLLEACRAFLDEVPLVAVRLGDVLVMRVQGTPDPHHFGIVTKIDGNRPTAMVHAMNVVGRVAEQPIDAKWFSRITHLFRFPGVID